MDELGDSVLAYLRRNPTIHEFADAFNFTLEEARTLQHLYLSFWQALLKHKEADGR